MSEPFDDILVDIQYNISMNISRYAKKKGITYQEAAKKAYMILDGVRIQPFESNDFSFTLNAPSGEKDNG